MPVGGLQGPKLPIPVKQAAVPQAARGHFLIKQNGVYKT